jgi:hypothetical protein
MNVSRWGIPLLVAVGLCLVAPACGAAASASSAPFTDPNAVGYIGLCNAAGQQITSGNVNTTPLASRAVSSEPAPAPYNNDYRTAILLAYQPQQGLSPGEWSGAELTASSRYTNPAHPMAEATGGDDSLEDFIGDFHPTWDGYVELRMYLGTYDAEVYSLQYPALDLQVTGDTWHAVGGGPVNCDAGSAESIETILLPKSTTSPRSTKTSTTTTSRAAASVGTGTPAGSDPTGALGTTPATATGPGSHQRAASGVLADSSGLAGDQPVAIAGIAALLVLAAAGVLVARRRRPAFASSMSGTPRHAHTKGDRS